MAKKEKSRFNKEKEALCRAHKGPVARKLRAKKNPLVGLCLHSFNEMLFAQLC